MKELLEGLVSLIPAYFADLLRFTSGPKRFLSERLSKRKATWNDGLIFLGISFLLTFVIQLPLTRTDPLLEVAAEGAFVLGYVVLFGYAAYLSWRIVGGAAPIDRFFVIHFYIAGVLKLILTVTFITVIGVLRTGDPASYEEMNKAIYGGNALWFLTNAERLSEHPVWRVALLVALAGQVAMLAWMATVWGAYRELNRLSKLRSGLAFLIFCVVCVPVYFFTSIVASGLIK